MTEESTATIPNEELTPILSGRLPDQDGGVNAIATLVEKASGMKLRRVNTKGLGDGLPEEVPLIFDHRPGGDVFDIKDLIETYRLEPKSREGTATALTLQSFIDLTNYHKDESSAIFADDRLDTCSLTAVIDYHQATHEPRWMKHRIRYPFPLTKEFKAWIAANGKKMEQGEFAQFLEDRVSELAAPFDSERTDLEHLFKEKVATPSELTALSRNLEVYVGSKVKRSERLSSGERTVEFVEEHTNAKGDKVEIPGLFLIALPAFQDGAPVRIPARLRYRITGGALEWFYQLYRWEERLRERVKDDLRIAAEETGLPAYLAMPETKQA